MLNEFLAWYLAPWRRMNRATFNVIVVLASLPTLALSLAGLAGGAGGVLGPLTDMMQASQSLQHGMDSGVLAPQLEGMGEAMRRMQAAGEGLGNVSESVPHFPFGFWLDTLIWLALVPIIHMRLRDTGIKNIRMWWWTGLVYAGLITSVVDKLAGFSVFGMWGWLAAAVSFVMLGWLCLVGSAPAKQVDPLTEPWHDTAP